jgi:hypothetical protein
MVKHCALSIRWPWEPNDPGLGCATSACLPNMRPVAGNPVTNSPCASRELCQSGGLTSYPGQDSNPRSELTQIFELTLSSIPLSHCNWPRLQRRIFSKVKTSFPTKPFAGSRRVPKVGDGGVFHTPCADFSRLVERLEYTCLLKGTFTEA